MDELLTAAEMRAIERAAIESGAVSGLELMERAGRGVVEAIFETWPELAAGAAGAAGAPAGDGQAGGTAPGPPGYLATEELAAEEECGRRAVVLCGPGNNGGDGFVVARLLKERGWAVEVFLYGEPARLPPDARVNCERWRAMGAVGDWAALAAFMSDFPPGAPMLLVDAVFGTGLSRPIPPEVGVAFQANMAWEFGTKLVSIDLPSGLCSDSGRVLQGDPGHAGDPVVGGRVCEADLVVSFHRAKLGAFLADGPKVIGRLVVKDIGLDGLRGLDGAQAARVVRRVGRPGWIELGKRARQHKYAHGHVLVLAGGPGCGGAARLAARGALRIGAGLVTLGCPPAALQENAGALDAVMLRGLKGGAGLAEALGDARINALCIGPGLGVARAAEMLAVALDGGGGGAKPRPVVIDADGLSALAGDAGLFARLHENCVLTPHGGEFRRLFPDIAEKLDAPAIEGPAFSKVDATRAAAARAGCVVLFKGADTVIAAPDGRCSLNAAAYGCAAPWLATAGAGDVLAGFVAGLLARGLAPMRAAEAGAWLHAECARRFGPGLIAEDLPETLPAVFRDLGL